MAFNLTTLSEYAKVQGGFAYKSKDFIEYSENRVLKIKNVRFGTVSYEEPAYISDEIAQSTEAWATKEGDILISMTGSGPNAPQSLVGRVARVWANEPQSYINQRVGRIQLIEEGKVHPDFLFYLLSLPQSQDFLVSNSSGSANQANISGKIIGLLPCPEVTYEESESIANMVRSLDEKIILNCQTNQTLEQMAQALFKSWFVDFDPVIDNALAAGSDIPEALQHKAEQRIQAQQLPDFKPLPDDIRALFPSEFEQTDEPSIGSSGWIPKGWAHKELSEIIEYQKGFAFKSAWYQDEGHIVVRVSDTTNNSVDVNSCNKISKELADEYAAYALKEDDLVIATVGSWPPNYSSVVGKVIRVPRTAEGGLLNQNAVKLTVNDEFSFHQGYLYCCLKNSRFMEYIVNRAQGSANQASITLKSIFNFSALLASSDVMELFSKQIKQNFKQQNLNYEQIESLTRLRDTLLPKLISGELSLISE